MAFLRLGIGDIRSAVKICGNSRIKLVSGWMSKQIDKQTNNKRLVLKKGQIAILEALYGGRFGGCRCFGLS